MRKVLFIGKSGTGKSRAATQLASLSRLPTYLVNDKVDKPESEKVFFEVDWDELRNLKSANVIIEDLIDCTPPQVELMKWLCNFGAHHRHLPLIVLISHSAKSNNIFSLIQNLTHVCFMRTRSTVPSLADVLTHLKFTKDEKGRMIDDFLADCKKGKWGYWTLELESGSFRRESTPDAATQPLDSLSKYRTTAQHYLGLFCADKDKALAVFEYILRKIPLQSLSAVDLTLGVSRGSKGEQERRLSLIDLIHALTTVVEPSEEVRALNAYICKYVDVPQCFISNPELKPSDGREKRVVNYVSSRKRRRIE